MSDFSMVELMAAKYATAKSLTLKEIDRLIVAIYNEPRHD